MRATTSFPVPRHAQAGELVRGFPEYGGGFTTILSRHKLGLYLGFEMRELSTD